MIKLIKNKYYSLKGYNSPLRFIGIYKYDYTCDLCNKNHYNNKGLPKLYCFEIGKDNYIKFGTKCILKILKLDKHI